MRQPLLVAALLTISAPALAQTPSATVDEEAPPPEEKKEPGQGDFDAGGQVRLPNGPDENGDFATFNWIALDLKGRYFILDFLTVEGDIPLAVKKPSTVMDEAGIEQSPSAIGGMSTKLKLKLPMPKKMPFVGSTEGNEVSLTLGGAVMREGAMLLSEKDYPLFTGGFKPGFTAGLTTKVKLGSVVDFQLLPQWVYQSGEMESLTAVQIPTSLVVALGDLFKVSADLGIYTGDDYTFRSSKGGRVALGAAIDVKLGPIVTHLGAGSASLGTGGKYPTIRDSVYFDLNVKYVK